MLAGLQALLTVENLLTMIVMSTIGLIIGALPGLSAVIAVALMLPFTFSMSPVTGLAALAAVYMAAVYGGCFTAILINTPGTPGSIATALDGYPMCKHGEGIKAIIGATLASTVGGLVGCLFLLLIAPPLAQITLKFGPPEYFWLTIFGLTIMASLGEGNIVKTLAGGFIGLLISCIGISTMGGAQRFTFGTYQLQGGVDLTVAMIGLFCMPEILSMLGNPGSLYDKSKTMHIGSVRSKWRESWHEFCQCKAVVALSSLIGTVCGVLPGAGGTIANVIAYNEAKKISPRGKEFGTGVMDGVVAPETANNATVGAGMIPTLTLGIPGTPVAAVIYGAMLMHGLQPGLELFQKSGDIAYSMIFAFIVATLIMLAEGLSIGTTLYKIVCRIPMKYLTTTVLLLAIIGSFSVRNNVLDVAIMVVMGFLGYLFKKFDLTPSAVVLGLILGNLCENTFIRSLLVSRGSSIFQTFFCRPICLALILVSLFSFAVPLRSAIKKMRTRKAEQEG